MTGRQDKIFDEAYIISAAQSKEDIVRAVLPVCCSFANADGGKIIVENTPSLSVSEIQDSIRRSFSDRNRISACTVSDMYAFSERGEDFILIDVAPAKWRDRPVFLNSNPALGTYRYFEGEFFVSGKKLLSLMARDSVNPQMDGERLSDFEFDREAIGKYRSILRERRPFPKWDLLSENDFLERIGATVDGEATLAGSVVFGPSRSLFEFRSESCKINSTGILNFTETALPVLLSFSDGTACEDALREAFFNCLIHADYSAGGAEIVVEGGNIFFRNSGIPRAKNKDLCISRNPRIMKMMRLVGFSSDKGWGMSAINAFRSEAYLSVNLDAWQTELVIQVAEPVIEEEPVETPQLFYPVVQLAPPSIYEEHADQEPEPEDESFVIASEPESIIEPPEPAELAQLAEPEPEPEDESFVIASESEPIIEPPEPAELAQLAEPEPEDESFVIASEPEPIIEPPEPAEPAEPAQLAEPEQEPEDESFVIASEPEPVIEPPEPAELAQLTQLAEPEPEPEPEDESFVIASEPEPIIEPPEPAELAQLAEPEPEDESFVIASEPELVIEPPEPAEPAELAQLAEPEPEQEPEDESFVIASESEPAVIGIVEDDVEDDSEIPELFNKTHDAPHVFISIPDDDTTEDNAQDEDIAEVFEQDLPEEPEDIEEIADEELPPLDEIILEPQQAELEITQQAEPEITQQAEPEITQQAEPEITQQAEPPEPEPAELEPAEPEITQQAEFEPAELAQLAQPLDAISDYRIRPISGYELPRQDSQEPDEWEGPPERPDFDEPEPMGEAQEIQETEKVQEIEKEVSVELRERHDFSKKPMRVFMGALVEDDEPEKKEPLQSLPHEDEYFDPETLPMIVQMVRNNPRTPAVVVREALLDFCRGSFRSLSDISRALLRSESSLKRRYIKPLLTEKALEVNERNEYHSVSE